MTMRATTRKADTGTFTQRVAVRHHWLTVDEPDEFGGDDEGPSPQELLAASLASCMAITIEMYATRKGWDVDQAEVEVAYDQPERGAPVEFKLTVRLPPHLTEEQRDRVGEIAARCPVHRTLEGEVTFEQRIELISPAG